jgi:hypothetical protein
MCERYMFVFYTRYLISQPEMFIWNKFWSFVVMFFLVLQISIYHAETHRWKGHKKGKIPPQFDPA